MSNIKDYIKSSEVEHQSKLKQEVEHCFQSIWMPSHNLDHHIRVWYFAKELLIAFENAGVMFEKRFVEGLLIATYFHDVGLTRTLSFEHGKESAAIAQEYMRENRLEKVLPLEPILEAIELHDDKEYLKAGVDLNKPSIYTLLTVADDLDAFGALGLYRYFEIYNLRQIESDEMTGLIEDNLKKRFDFVSRVIRINNDLVAKHKCRFEQSLSLLKQFQKNDVDYLLAQISNQKSYNSLSGEGGLVADFIEQVKQEASKI